MSVSLQLLLAFALAVLLTAVWLRFALKQRWLVQPNARSSHAIPTPSGGGIGFVVVFIAYLLLRRQEVLSGWDGVLALAGTMMLATLGFIDDFLSLGIRSRLVLQLIAVGLLWPFLQQMPPLVLFSSVALSGVWLSALLVLILLWHVNLYNFMDGIDALAAAQAMFFCVAVPLLVSVNGGAQPASAMLILGAAVCGFLFFNLPRARLFMGDAGSYFLGYLLLVLALALVREGVIGIWTILVLTGTFVADSTATLLGRFWEGAVWYHPHRTHAYQLLAIRWKSHGKVVATYTALNVFWLVPLAWLSMQRPNHGLLLTVIAWTPLMMLVRAVRSRARPATS